MLFFIISYIYSMTNTHPAIPVWKTAPFVRLLPPFIAGIVLQWYLQLPFLLLPILAMLAGAFLLGFRLLREARQFRWQWIQGLLLNLLVLLAGAWVTRQKDVRLQPQWFGHTASDTDYLVVRINEPLVPKTKSYKAEAIVEAVVHGDSSMPCNGKILLYFSKDSLPPALAYGDKILLHQYLQPIKNSGNPGAFNYERYAAFQGYFHNVFLRPADYRKLPQQAANWFWQWIYKAKAAILLTLRQNIHTRDELGIAEALLIGYKEDLDKDLVQAYSNTGVVHIIAISGLHLGLIYALLLWLFNRMPLVRRMAWLKAALLIGSLWLFSLLTGASASVLRSAVMFTFIILGEHAGKRSSMYNSLAVSAILLLVYNPYLLWDVGFQLSYLAVGGIAAFQVPVYNWFTFHNKLADYVWRLAAVSLAAQVLTFPVCIYYFHQFPVLFLLANLVAVPLSAIILYAAIALVVFGWLPFAATWLGKCTAWLVLAMNKVIGWINQLPFALWDGIAANLLSTWLLYALVLAAAGWLLRKHKYWLRFSLLMALLFGLVQAYSRWQTYQQYQLVVYNVPQRKAIDFIAGHQYRFMGDSMLLEDGVLQNFHLKPARIKMQLNRRTDHLPGLQQQGRLFMLGHKKFLLLDTTLHFAPASPKINVDIIILSGNPKVSIPELAAVFNCGQYVFDASNPLWKINYWKTACEQLLLRCHSTAQDGAFVYPVQ